MKVVQWTAVAICLLVLVPVTGLILVGGTVTAMGSGTGSTTSAEATSTGVTSTGATSTGEPVPTASATERIPAQMLRLYQRAAAVCPGLSWTVLAGIGTVESDNGLSELPGVHTGSNFAGAEGPMQFEPATFAIYAIPVPPGGARPPSPYDPVDAVYAAARYLCANGAGDSGDLRTAIYAYDHSASYVSQVLSLATSYGRAGTPAGAAQAEAGAGTGAGAEAGAGAGVVAVEWALGQVGTPYVWGGETPGVGFDCSGLVQAAYEVAGISLPRVAQGQFDAGAPLASGTVLQPGDLVFFGASTSDVTHVGLYVGADAGRSIMLDAPHTRADVRLEAFPTHPGAAWGRDVYLGATRPSS
jgi:cell wall-associated NlpC family hydrolase